MTPNQELQPASWEMETRKWKTMRKWDYSQDLSSPPLHNHFVLSSLQSSFHPMLLYTQGSHSDSPVNFSQNCRVRVKDQLGLLSQSQNMQEREFNSVWIRHPPLIQTAEKRWESWSNNRGYPPVQRNYTKWQQKWQRLLELWLLLQPQGFPKVPSCLVITPRTHSCTARSSNNR